MKLRLLLAAILVVVCAGSANAQDAIVEGPGYKVGEGTVFHPSAGLETGFISNVFYEDADPVASPVLRLLARFHIASLSEQRLQQPTLDPGLEPAGDPPKLEFRAGVRLAYQEYLSDNADARAQRDLAVGADLHAKAFPSGTVAFTLDNNFVRDTRPTNFESSRKLNRDINHLKVGALFQPGGRALTGGVRYENIIDVFESDNSSFADRIQHIIGVRTDWQFLPVTRFYFDGSLGFFGPLGDSVVAGQQYKQSSNPLRLLFGVNTAITEFTSFAARAGFGKGFYEEGAEFVGPIMGAQVSHRYSPFGRATIQYDYDFKDSINANFFTDHAVEAAIDQQLALFFLRAAGTVRFRSYQGIPMVIGGPTERDDMILAGSLRARYMYRDWLAVTADYEVTVVDTEYRYMFEGFTDDPGYVRHQATLGVQAAF